MANRLSMSPGSSITVAIPFVESSGLLGSASEGSVYMAELYRELNKRADDVLDVGVDASFYFDDNPNNPDYAATLHLDLGNNAPDVDTIVNTVRAVRRETYGDMKVLADEARVMATETVAQGVDFQNLTQNTPSAKVEF